MRNPVFAILLILGAATPAFAKPVVKVDMTIQPFETVVRTSDEADLTSMKLDLHCTFGRGNCLGFDCFGAKEAISKPIDVTVISSEPGGEVSGIPTRVHRVRTEVPLTLKARRVGAHLNRCWVGYRAGFTMRKTGLKTENEYEYDLLWMSLGYGGEPYEGSRGDVTDRFKSILNNRLLITFRRQFFNPSAPEGFTLESQWFSSVDGSVGPYWVQREYDKKNGLTDRYFEAEESTGN